MRQKNNTFKYSSFQSLLFSDANILKSFLCAGGIKCLICGRLSERESWDRVKEWVWEMMMRLRLIRSKLFVQKKRKKHIPRPALLNYLEFTAHAVFVQTCQVDLTPHSSHFSSLCSLLSSAPFFSPMIPEGNALDCDTTWGATQKKFTSPGLCTELMQTCLHIHATCRWPNYWQKLTFCHALLQCLMENRIPGIFLHKNT